MKQYHFLLIAMLLVTTALLLSFFYRPYIYQNHIFDYHLADTIGSLFSVPAATFFFRGISSKYTFNQFILITTLAYLIYECLGLIYIIGVFDSWDVLAILVGALLTFVVNLLYPFEKKLIST